MRRIRRIGLALYLIAAVVVAGACAGSLFGPYTERIGTLMHSGTGRIVMAVCLVVVALNALAVIVYLMLDRPEPSCMRLSANPDIEVTTDALVSIARTAAAERDVMVEDVRVRVVGRDRAGVDVRIDAIALAPLDLDGVARRVQRRVQDACDGMLGVPGARVQVRFLPSKTVTVVKEVAGEY